ncbi:MAG: hypothetical protein DRI32_05465 [Chloroflexi bacterium]|nr:MAG: hypothetical protein DRI32_05465 [Chloroflexota bacterium]
MSMTYGMLHSPFPPHRRDSHEFVRYVRVGNRSRDSAILGPEKGPRAPCRHRTVHTFTTRRLSRQRGSGGPEFEDFRHVVFVTRPPCSEHSPQSDAGCLPVLPLSQAERADLFSPRPHPVPAVATPTLALLFSEEDIRRLLLVADSLRPHPGSPLHQQVCRIAIVLLYTTGLRRGELVRLRLGDYDPGEQVLLVRESKFYKSRLVPLSEDAVANLSRYLDCRRRTHFPCGDDRPLLIHRHGALTGYSGPGLGHLLHKLFLEAGVRTSAGRTPRTHDLRFTFAVHAMLRWYRAGVDVQVRLPALSIYMGHASVVSTQYYLAFLNTIAEAAGDRFEKHCSRFLQTPSFEGGEV